MEAPAVDAPSVEAPSVTPPRADRAVTWTAPSPAQLRLRRPLRAGRLVSDVSWGMLGVGALLVPVGAGLTVYDFRGDWEDKWKYDAAYLARSEASTPVMLTGAAIASSHIPMLLAGTLVEGRALRAMTLHRTTVGWVGLGVFIGGGATFGLGLATNAAPLIVFGGAGMAGGWACAIAQYAINVRTARRLPEAVRDGLYHGRPPVRVSLAPLGGPSPGLAVFGSF